MLNDSLIMQGGAVKALKAKDNEIKLGGYLVVFGDKTKTDLAGDYFTPDTYFGAHGGDGVDTLFHHSLEVKGLEGFTERIFAPLKVTKDEVGLFAEWTGDAKSKYDRALHKAGIAGKLGFSSGSAPHMVRYADGKDSGEIKRWPIIEGSFTPTPCEPRARAAALKSLEAETSAEAMQNFVSSIKSIFETQEQAEDAFLNVADENSRMYQRNWKLEEANYQHRQFMSNAVEAMRALHGLYQNERHS